MKRLLLTALLIIGTIFDSFASQWPDRPLGGNEKLFFNEETFIEARERIDNCRWAKKLYRSLKKRLEVINTPMPEDFALLQEKPFWAKEAAIYYRLSGDDRYIEEIRDQLISTYMLDHMETPMFDTTAKADLWSRVMAIDCLYLPTYDLIKNHPAIAPYQTRMEARLDELIAEGKRYDAGITRLGNTHFYGVTVTGLAGFMRDDQEAIELAINGRNGFKALLHKFRDNGSFWPEPKLYCHGYVDCCILMLAEAALMNNYEDLYAYEDPETGASIEKMIVSLITSCTPDGYSISNGEHSEFPLVLDGKFYNERPGIFNKATIRKNTKLPIYYRRLKNPVVGWAMKKFPENDEYCIQFWGHSALLYGAEVGNIQAPDARSYIYPEMGDALIRADETGKYWDGESLSVYFRNGASQQYHGHDDHLSININAYGKNLYNHWFYNWDYLCPRKGRGNKTPISQELFNHNTVTVDFKRPDRSNIHLSRKKKERAGLEFSGIKRSGDMKIVSAEGSLYEGVHEKRTLAVTEDYVIDIFEIRSAQAHNYDYSLHSWGELTWTGVSGSIPYPQLNEEYRLQKIDENSTVRKENVWHSDVMKAVCTGDLLLDFHDKDRTGIRTYILGNDKSEVIRGMVPMYISIKGWDDGPQKGFAERKPMVFVRRQCCNTTYYAVHQPYRKHAGKLDIRKDDNSLIVRGPGFEDEYNIETQEYTRKILK